MILEPARESDWEAIQRISVQIHDLHVNWRPDIYYHSEAPYPREFFLEDLEEELIYVARLQQDVVGYVCISVLEKGGPGTVDVKQLRLDSICVDEAYRGRGIGKAMVEDLCAVAEKLGCSSLILGVHPENTKAIAFYETCGFTVRTINMEKKI